MQTHLSPSLLPETHWERADGQSWEWRRRVERLLRRSVQLQRTRTHLCQLVEGSREGHQLWTAPPHWVPACLQRSLPLPSHLVVHQQLECQDQPPGGFPLQTPHWPSYHGDSEEGWSCVRPTLTGTLTHSQTTHAVVNTSSLNVAIVVSEVT